MAVRFVSRRLVVSAVVLTIAWGAATVPARPQARQLAIDVLYEFASRPNAPSGALVRGPDGTLYGVVHFAPGNGGGIYSLTPAPDGSFAFNLLHAFNVTDGSGPLTGLTLASDGHMYGTTLYGGANGFGTIFRITTGGTFTLLHSFSRTDGELPVGRLIQASDGLLYGTTVLGGAFSAGTIFSLSTSGGAPTTRHSFSGPDGAGPISGLVQASDGQFYGTTGFGGSGNGTFFRMTAGGAVTRLYSFNGDADGRIPLGDLVQGADGFLYGTMFQGGLRNAGTAFRISTSGAFTRLHSFSQSIGPSAVALTPSPDGSLFGVTTGMNPPAGGGVEFGGAIFRLTASGIVQTAHRFWYFDGAKPWSPLLPVADGAFGTTTRGGAENMGTVFHFAADTGLRTIYAFRGGFYTPQGLTRGRDGSFYGTTRTQIQDGAFKITADGVYVPLHAFMKHEGIEPSRLIHATDGNLYGTTRTGGNGTGTIFRMTPDGAVTILYSFTDYDGIAGTPLVEASDGNFYGTTEIGGGPGGDGSVFRITPSGVYTILHAFAGPFSGPDGSTPHAGVIDGADGHLYGTTAMGGVNGNGTIFRITKQGAVTTLHSFNGADGSEPDAELLQASDGILYGTTSHGGLGNGTVFAITTAGVFTLLHTFPGPAGGEGRPFAPLTEAPDGTIYGTSVNGIFRLDAQRAFSMVHTFPIGTRESETEGGSPGRSNVIWHDGAFYGTNLGGRDGRGMIYRLPLAPDGAPARH